MLANPEIGILDDLVDLDRYPIDRPGEAVWANAASDVATALRRDGISQCKGFMKPDAIAALRSELTALIPHSNMVADERSAYARDLDGSNGDEPTSTWKAGHITRDMLPPFSPAQRLYVAPGFKAFIAQCLGRAVIYEYADPLASLICTVLPPGGTYGWHYDTTEFVITLSVACASVGGQFEFVRNLRRPGDENDAGLRDVLGGDRTNVQTLHSEPGELQIFLGRYSLHRVTTVESDENRLTLVLAYADRPGVIGPVDRTRRVYGRVTEAHLTASPRLHDHDGLIL